MSCGSLRRIGVTFVLPIWYTQLHGHGLLIYLCRVVWVIGIGDPQGRGLGVWDLGFGRLYQLREMII